MRSVLSSPRNKTKMSLQTINLSYELFNLGWTSYCKIIYQLLGCSGQIHDQSACYIQISKYHLRSQGSENIIPKRFLEYPESLVDELFIYHTMSCRINKQYLHFDKITTSPLIINVSSCLMVHT